jgi:hypothetical protein
MKLLEYADTFGDDYCVKWMNDGKSFIITNPDEFTKVVVPMFFKPTKFSSFTRKLYRWGFRQVNRGIGPEDPIIFGCDFFQRDDAALMTKMRSTTAAGARKIEQAHAWDMQYSGAKHGYDFNSFEDLNNKRTMLEQMYNDQKINTMSAPISNLYFNTNGTMSLSSALRPNMSYQGNQQQQLLEQMQTVDSQGFQNQQQQFLMIHQNQQQQLMMMQQQQQLQQQQHLQHQGFNNMSAFDMMQQMHGGNMTQFLPQNNLSGNQYANPGSTAEIVNAAISALRFAN